MNKTAFDPKLKQAVEEIKIVLKKYDCNASIILVSPSHAEYLFHIDSSWSVMKFEDGQNAIRFRSKKDDFPSKEAQIFANQSTMHYLTSSLQFGLMCQKNMDTMLNELKKFMIIAWEVWK
jgi:hypothetical protein